MMLNLFTFLTILILYSANAAVFLWSNREIRVPPLQPFTMKDFFKLAEQLEHPEIQVFESPTPLSSNLKEITNGYYSAYNPNGLLDAENITYLIGDGDLDLVKIKELTIDFKSKNFLFAITVPRSNRLKREVDLKNDTSDESVVYRAQNVNTKLYALLYSSKSLLLKRNDSYPAELHLGKTSDPMVNFDYRLNVNVVPLDPEEVYKVILRFNFKWVNGYWYMSSVKIEDPKTNKDYNLTTAESIMGPAYFSYHCNGHTVFTDNSGTELHIYDLQVQPDSRNGKFDDANDCVPFTTAPIWSGIFVTSLLCIGLIVALTAIMDIKTMDKFDTQKTKNLSITVSE